MAESEYSIAITGMTCRYPKADNIDEFWQNLLNGRNCIYRDTSLDDTMHIGAFGQLDNIADFDAEFFEMSPREALDSDPQGRIMLEMTHHLLENCGCSNLKYKGKTGVYISFDNSIYVWNNIMRAGKDWYDKYQMSKVYIATRAERIAYKFGFEGPAIMSEYACASSINSIHQACQSLLNYECDLALAGGISAEMRQDRYISGLNTMSDKGEIRPFDKDSDGLIPSSGAGLISLKRYEDAVNDHDNIIAVIRGTYVNNDGNRKAGFGAPSVFGQMECLQNVLAVSETDIDDVDYIETHGTATELGDSIEARAIKNVVRKRPDDNKLLIGSVKSNIGHTNMAAGVANVIKTAFMLNKRTLVPTINFSSPCDELSEENCPVEVCTKCGKWEKDKQLVAVASAVGFGGANAMAVLSEYIPEVKRKPESRDIPKLMLVSGKTKTAAEIIRKDTETKIKEGKIRLDDMAYTLQCGRNDYKYRTFIIADDKSIQRRRVTEFVKKKKNIVFVFSGAGDFRRTVGKELYNSDSIFRKYMNECFEYAKQSGTDDLKQFYLDFNFDSFSENIDNEKGIMILFSVGYSLAKTLEEYGIKADRLIGHSNGEYIAATVSGIISPVDAFKMLHSRAELMETLSEGGMLNVVLSEVELMEILPPELEIGAVNAPNRIMVTGEKNALDKFETLLKEKNVICSRMNVNRAGHCSAIENISAQYAERIKDIHFSEGTIPVVSTDTPDAEGNNRDIKTPDYWVRQMRNRVNFYDAVTAVEDRNNSVFIELGMSDTLTSMIRKMRHGDSAISAFAAFGSPTAVDSRKGFLELAGELWCAGIPIDWEKLYDELPYKTVISNYPFERKTYLDYSDYFDTVPSECNARETVKLTYDTVIEDSSVPKNETEKKLIDIIKNVLGYDVSPEENLYEHGMDSLMAMMISSKVREQFQLEIKLSDMYNYTTIREISDYLLSGNVEMIAIEKNSEDDISEKNINDLFDEL